MVDDSTIDEKISIKDQILVLVATPDDDPVIASIRQIVFWNHFKHENIQQYNFHHRSCEVLAIRRSHGAVCLVSILPSMLLCMIPLDMALELD